jgi:hypothetical protein
MSGLFVRRSAHVNVRYFTNSLTPPTGLGLLTCRLRGGEVSVGQRVARSLPERWPAVLPQGRFIRGSSPSTRARWAALVTALFNRLLAVTTTRCATVNRSSIRSCILQGAKHRHSNGRNRSHLRPTGACHLFGHAYFRVPNIVTAMEETGRISDLLALAIYSVAVFLLMLAWAY